MSRLVCAAAVYFATIAAHAQMATPDPHLTPGAVWTTRAADVCSRALPPGPSAAEWLNIKLGRMLAYGLPWDRRGAHELDHLIPRCAGGTDEPANLWPQPWPQARMKDLAEIDLCRQVCEDPSDARLRAVQQYFRSGEWSR